MRMPEKVKKQVARFPMVYRIQAENAIDIAVRDAIDITADSFIMAGMLTLIEDFGFGTTEYSTKLKKYIAGIQKRIDTNAEKFEDAVAEGFRVQLHNYGVDFRR